MKTKFLFFLAALFVLTSCNKEILCTDQEDENKGDIVENFQIDCFFSIPNDQMVIRNQEEYTTFSASVVNNTQSSNCDFPTIDFEKHSLVGLTTQGSGCSRSYVRSFSESENQTYLYDVKVRECGQCEPLEINHNLILVPKLKEGWTVRFQSKVTNN